uniref:Uncharacterized protein n=1 Tax=Parascaris equorum TaxID=6256 RepID=A0A914R2P3_PAREQ
MFVRFLGRDFMWMLVGQTRIDTLNRSDIRLLHPANVSFLFSHKFLTFIYFSRAKCRC